jgi:phosphinothricin acetyltransferase
VAVRIRLAEDADMEAIAAIYRPIVEATAISFEITAPDRDEMARRVGATMKSYPWLVCDMDGRIAGYAYGGRHRARPAYRWSAETSVYIDDAFRRRGVGRGLYDSLFAILAAQGYRNALAGITLPNPASVALHESMGFEKVGVYRAVGYKFGRWHDVGWWQRALAGHEESPRDPLDLTEVSRQPGWKELLARGESLVRLEIA